jgi:hypothetical protein
MTYSVTRTTPKTPHSMNSPTNSGAIAVRKMIIFFDVIFLKKTRKMITFASQIIKSV